VCNGKNILSLCMGSWNHMAFANYRDFFLEIFFTF